MKVHLDKAGFLVITAETITEAWALNVTCPPGAEKCDKCGYFPTKVSIDGTILLFDSKEE